MFPCEFCELFLKFLWRLTFGELIKFSGILCLDFVFVVDLRNGVIYLGAVIISIYLLFVCSCKRGFIRGIN